MLFDIDNVEIVCLPFIFLIWGGAQIFLIWGNLYILIVCCLMNLVAFGFVLSASCSLFMDCDFLIGFVFLLWGMLHVFTAIWPLGKKYYLR